MPNSIYVPGSPVLNAIKGFDRPQDLWVLSWYGFTFIGYKYQCENIVVPKEAEKNNEVEYYKFNPEDYAMQ